MKKSLATSTTILWNKHTSMKALDSAVSTARTKRLVGSFARKTSNLPFATTLSPWCRDFSKARTTLSPSTTSSGTVPSAAVSNRGGAIIHGHTANSASAATALAIHLPPADDPVGLQLYKKAIYCPISRILKTSAHVGSDNRNQKADGIVDDSVTPEEARTHARNSGLRLLATIHDFLDGDLGRVEQVLHLKGMVKSTKNFSGHAGVIDGCSEVLVQAFGPDAGVGTRECFGVGSLGATVACILELRVRPLK